jgi:hypothetical protein
MTLPILLTLIAAFAGGAVSTVFADWIRSAITSRARRAALLRRLYDEVSAWVDNIGDLYVQGTGEILSVSPFEAPSVGRMLESGLLGNRDNDLRNSLLALQRATSRYNGEYAFALLRQAQDWNTGRAIRKDAANYAHQTLLPRLQNLRNLLRQEYGMKD